MDSTSASQVKKNEEEVPTLPHDMETRKKFWTLCYCHDRLIRRLHLTVPDRLRRGLIRALEPFPEERKKTPTSQTPTSQSSSASKVDELFRKLGQDIVSGLEQPTLEEVQGLVTHMRRMRPVFVANMKNKTSPLQALFCSLDEEGREEWRAIATEYGKRSRKGGK